MKLRIERNGELVENVDLAYYSQISNLTFWAAEKHGSGDYIAILNDADDPLDNGPFFRMQTEFLEDE